MNLFYIPDSTCVEVILLRPVCVSISAVIVAPWEMLPLTLISTRGLCNTSAWSPLLQLLERTHGMTCACLLSAVSDHLEGYYHTSLSSGKMAFTLSLSLSKRISSGVEAGHRESEFCLTLNAILFY